MLGEFYKSQRLPGNGRVVDIAGLVKGASQGEGLGNQFLSNIREVDAILHVVRCFENDNVVHVDGSVNPVRDIETINLELIFSDLEIMERRISRIRPGAGNDKALMEEFSLLRKIKTHLEQGFLANTLEFTEEEQELAKTFHLLTDKPVIYAANISEEDLADDGASNLYVQQVRTCAENEKSEVFVVSAKMEAELSELEEEEKASFLEDLGLSESCLDKLIKAGCSALGLTSFLTAGEKEVRAWTITKGMKAKQAAGKIHTDFEKGFIKAEVVGYEDLISLGSYAAAKEKGLVRMEGKDYVIRDNDIIVFRFNI